VTEHLEDSIDGNEWLRGLIAGDPAGPPADETPPGPGSADGGAYGRTGAAPEADDMNATLRAMWHQRTRIQREDRY
jgi:hypothetical protein